jgi:LPXTG-site transpeptidase (sortase) family protein
LRGDDSSKPEGSLFVRYISPKKYEVIYGQSLRRPLRLNLLLMGLTLLLAGGGCSDIIKIEFIPTPTAALVESSQTPIATGSVSGTGIPSRIVDEVIDLDAPVVEMGWRLEKKGEQIVSQWIVPENEAGWHLNSARPGQGSNIVISGHNNSSGGHVFANLEELTVGSQLTVWTDEGESYIYQVSERRIIKAFGASQETLDYLQAVIQPTATEQLTLITCWPSWTNTHRLIIIAEPL